MDNPTMYKSFSEKSPNEVDMFLMESSFKYDAQIKRHNRFGKRKKYNGLFQSI